MRTALLLPVLSENGLKNSLLSNSSPGLIYLARHNDLLTSTSTSTYVLALRLIGLMLLVAVLVMHVRSMRVFRWEQSVSGGVLVTCLLSQVGLALSSGVKSNKCKFLEAYLRGICGTLLVLNGAAICHRWYSAEEPTRAVAEILFLVGVQLKRQLMIKVILCLLAGFAMFLDFALIYILTTTNVSEENHQKS